MQTVYLNGAFMPIDEARVSPMDRGFLFGDGAYEVIPVYSRRAFRLAEHLKRLQSTLSGIRLSNPHQDHEWQGLIAAVIARNQPEDQSIYLHVSRGADAKRDHAFPVNVPPTVFIMSSPLTVPSAEQRSVGVAAVSAADYRWTRCHLKTTALLPNCMLRQLAVDSGGVETLLFRDGYLTEGAASNIFIVKGGVLLAPPKNHFMLPGITYDVVLELAAARGLPHEVREILEHEVREADEIWMTSSSKEILPITTLDGRPVGTGRPGPAAEHMHRWYQEFKDTVMRRS
jgi:D-alanine transaminase